MSTDVTTDLTTALAELVATLPPEIVVTGEASLEKYRYDWIHDGSAGHPLAAVRPRNPSEVQACMRWAHEHRVPVITRGAGTGLSGGARAVDGCLILSTEAMRSIVVDPSSRTARVEPGALNAEVKLAAARAGLFYPPDPGSFRISSIGGNIATNAGGLCCVKYGVTSHYVLGLTVVLADGRLVELGGSTIKNVAGLSLTQLFVGSEGTLGVIVGATLRLTTPQRPQVTVVMAFPTLEATGQAVIRAGRTIQASMMELMNRQCINNIEDYRPSGLDRKAAALLIAQCDSTSDATALAAIAAEVGATEVYVTEDVDEGNMFVEIRRNTGPALERRGSIIPEDIAVPLSQLPVALQTIQDIAAESGVEISVVAHAGDGNLHPTICYDPNDGHQVIAAQQVFQRVTRLAISLGGTITGEHGVGRAKRSLLGEQLDPGALDLAHAIKNALDPSGILNPGSGF